VVLAAELREGEEEVPVDYHFFEAEDNTVLAAEADSRTPDSDSPDLDSPD